jgi:hypothetical protein
VHHGEHGHLVAEKLLVEQCTIAFDVAGLFERAHSPQTGRRRDADPARKLDIGHAAILLQLLENLPVDGIETSGHGNAPDSLLLGPLSSNSAAGCERFLPKRYGFTCKYTAASQSCGP